MKLTGTFTVQAVKKKTSAMFFKDLNVGDTFTLSYNLNGYYTGAPSIRIYKDGEYVHSNTALQLKNNLGNFELTEGGRVDCHSMNINVRTVM
jgi:hypothetical protein